MNSQEIMSFLNHNQPVKTAEYLVTLRENLKSTFFFNAFNNENIISISWSFTKVFV